MTDLLFTFAFMVVGVFVVIGLLKLLGKGTKIATKAAGTPRRSVLLIALMAAALSVRFSDLGMLWVLAGFACIAFVIFRARRKAAPWELSDQTPRAVAHVLPPVERHPDAVLVDRIRADWPNACYDAGLVVADPDRSLAWQQAGNDRGSGYWLDDSLTIVTSALTRKSLTNTPGLIIKGNRAFLHPRLHSATASKVGPVFTAEARSFPYSEYESRCMALASALRVSEIQPSQTREQASNGVLSLTVRIRDPFARDIVLDSVHPASDLTNVPFALGEDMEWRFRSYANVAAEVIGGVPGSGKTSGTAFEAVALAQNPCVQLVLIDGKGGSDWSFMEPRASIFCDDDEDLARVAEVVGMLKAIMRHRLRTQKAERGSSNFWHLPLSPDWPVIFAFVDECQTFLDKAELVTKEQKELGAQIHADLKALIKKGRSAGIITKLLTQKPTSDAIPTDLRDNASVRTCCRVMTRQAAEAVLGDGLSESTVTPVAISEHTKGVAVVNAGSSFERVRFPFVPESVLERIALETAHLRRDLAVPVEPEPEDADSDSTQPISGPIWERNDE